MLYSNVTDRINLKNSNDAVMKKIDMHTYIYTRIILYTQRINTTITDEKYNVRIFPS